MTLQQLRRQLDNLKEKITRQNTQVECLLSNAREELIIEINRIGERLRYHGEACVLCEADKEELFKKVLESCEGRIKDPYFQLWVRGV